VGIPIILLHDGEGSIVTVELKTGELIRGYLEDSEDNMNCVVKVPYYTKRDKLILITYIFIISAGCHTYRIGWKKKKS